jgi:chemotaxis protein CheZ
MKFYSDINIDLVEELLESMETGDEGRTSDLIDRIVSLRESEVFLQINNLSVNLTQTLSEIGADTTIIKEASDLSEVKERLQYVLTSTQESSDKVLSQAENISDKLGDIRATLTPVTLSKKNNEALNAAIKAVEHDVTEIILAQSFQDLTGQVITKVIAALGILEESLNKVIKKSGQDMDSIVNSEKSGASGPSVTEKEKNSAVTNQDEVDDLLDDLGI